MLAHVRGEDLHGGAGVRALRCCGAVFLLAASVLLLRLAALLLLILTLLSGGRWQPLFFSFPTARGARAHEED